MKRKFFAATIIGGGIMLGLCLSGGAAQFSTKKNLLPPVQPALRTKAGAKTPPHSQPRHLHPKKPIKRLPDLVVEKIWLNRGYIAFSLKNGGKGAIPDKEHKNGKVAVTYGGKTLTCALTEKSGGNAPVDPNGTLKSPGHTITYTTGIKIKSAKLARNISIKVYVDSTKKIQEQNEGNNTETARLAIPGIKVVSKKRGTKTLKTGKPKSAGSPIPPSARLEFKGPKISIEKIYFHDGTVHVLLRNHGKARLTTGKLRSVTLRLSREGKIRTWHLAGIDRAGHLRLPGGSLDFDTGIAIATQTHIIAQLGKGRHAKSCQVFLHLKAAEVASRSHVRKTSLRASTGTFVKAPGNLKKPMPAIPNQGRQPNRPLPAPLPDSGGQGTGTAAGRAKLALESLEIIPASPKARMDTVKLRATVKNIGLEKTYYRCSLSAGIAKDDGYSLLNLTLSDEQQHNIPRFLEPGGEYVVEIPFTFSEQGPWSVIVMLWTDPLEQAHNSPAARAHPILGGNPSSLEKKVTVLSPPIPGDLALTLLTTTRDGHLRIEMHNQSLQYMRQSDYNFENPAYIKTRHLPENNFRNSTIKVHIENSRGLVRDVTARMDEVDPHGLLKFRNVTRSYTWPVQDAGHPNGIDPAEISGCTVQVTLNSNRSIFETDYRNNSRSKHFCASPQNLEKHPDLVVCMKRYIRLTWPVTKTFHMHVVNIGTAPSAATKLSFHVGGHGTSHHDIPPLQPGEDYTAKKTFTWGNSGTNHYKLIIDYENKVTELEEDNNILCGIITRGHGYSDQHPMCSDMPYASVPVP